MVDIGLPKPDSKNPIRVRTPHAAVLIWNYKNRIGSLPTGDIDSVEPVFISTVSCVSMRTSKSKSDPQGTFQLVLAPNRNWVSMITPGSWCAILMSNKPITALDKTTVDPSKLKMIGKIDTVRVDTKVNPQDGARTTLYYVSGVDWGHVFNNIIYIDNNLAAASDPVNLGNSAAIAIQKLLFGEKGTPKRFSTSENIKALMGIFGKELSGFTAAGNKINLLANAVYNFNIPKEVSLYLRLQNSSGLPIPPLNINSAIKLVNGALQTTEDNYKDTQESYGFLNPFSLQGAHSFWQVLQENSNPVVNEMIAEMRPGTLGTQLILYNRIKPFAIKGSASALALAAIPGGLKVMSFFQNIKTHTLDPMTITSINAGTNWKDKYNFAEIKPQFTDERILEASLKIYTQTFDQLAFNREGFRPLIYSAKYLPGLFYESPSLVTAAWTEIKGWVTALRAWYFDTHKMLNGTVTLTGIDGYIAVGDNIKFDAKLVNPNKNFNIGQFALPFQANVLAHVENVSHGFSIKDDGSREYTTTIQFVRGIIVDQTGTPTSVDVGGGAVDVNRATMPERLTQNNSNTVTSPSPDHPKNGKT